MLTCKPGVFLTLTRRADLTQIFFWGLFFVLLASPDES
jgi:hypothetical protein